MYLKILRILGHVDSKRVNIFVVLWIFSVNPEIQYFSH